MRDKYDISGQVGAVGPNANAHDITFNQLWNDTSNKIDLEALTEELPALRKSMKKESNAPEHDLAVGAVANAEIAAKNGDGPAVLKHLKTAGKWSLSCAEKIGTGVAVAALKTSLGI